jgi:hypothetical protein
VSEPRTPPPPSAALLEAVAKMKPVATRVPWRALAVVTALSLGYAALAFALFTPRPDLGDQPRAYIVVGALLWLLGFALPLGGAILPRRGQVLPDPGRAVRLALVTAAALIAISLFSHEIPGKSRVVDQWPGIWHCLKFVLRGFGVPYLIALIALVGIVRIGSWRAGAALGASAGALAGMVLHFICAYADATHVVIAHVGGVLLSAGIGALVAPLILERRQGS